MRAPRARQLPAQRVDVSWCPPELWMRNWRPIVKMPGTSLSASKRVVGPRQAGLLSPDHCRWAPSQGLSLGGSRPRLLGYSDGFAPDSHRLPFSALLEPPIGRSLLLGSLAGPPPPPQRPS